MRPLIQDLIDTINRADRNEAAGHLGRALDDLFEARKVIDDEHNRVTQKRKLPPWERNEAS